MDESQSERFKQAARELGCDGEERFVETVRKIAKAPPQHKGAKTAARPAKKAKR